MYWTKSWRRRDSNWGRPDSRSSHNWVFALSPRAGLYAYLLLDTESFRTQAVGLGCGSPPFGARNHISATATSGVQQKMWGRALPHGRGLHFRFRPPYPAENVGKDQRIRGGDDYDLNFTSQTTTPPCPWKLTFNEFPTSSWCAEISRPVLVVARTWETASPCGT